MSQSLSDAIDTYDKIAEHMGTCGDGGCLVLKPKGMHTNGGCRCSTDKYRAQRMMFAGKILREALRTELK